MLQAGTSVLKTGERVANLLKIEAATRQEALAPSALFRCFTGAVKAPRQGFPSQLKPVDLLPLLHFFKSSVKGFLVDTALAQFAFNTNNTLASQNARAYETSRKTRIGLQVLFDQGI